TAFDRDREAAPPLLDFERRSAPAERPAGLRHHERREVLLELGFRHGHRRLCGRMEALDCNLMWPRRRAAPRPPALRQTCDPRYIFPRTVWHNCPAIMFHWRQISRTARGTCVGTL